MEKFAFIIHPINLKDVERFETGAKGRSTDLVLKVLEWTPPFKVSHVTGIKSKTGKEAEGWFVACPLVPEQFLKLDTKFTTEKIVRAGQLSEKLGAKIVGLGAFTAIAGDAGITVSKNLNIATTTGNSYTVYSAIEGAREGARLMGIDINHALVAVVGATGSIGQVCAEILADIAPRVSLIARNIKKLSQLKERIEKKSKAQVSINPDVTEAIKEADVVITVTSSLDVVVDPYAIKSGAVVCDVARPRDVSAEVAKVRDDVLVIDGGAIKVPGEPEFNYDFGFPRGMAYACMAETMILALEGRYEDFSIGKDLQLNRVIEIGKLAQKHGFELTGMRSFERALTPDKISQVRNKAENNLNKSKTQQESKEPVSPKPYPGTHYSY